MSAIIKILNHRISYHFYFWGVFFAVFAFFGSGSRSLFFGLKMSVAFIIPWIFVTYTHFYFHSRFFANRKYVIYFILTLLTILIFGYLSQLSVNYILYENHFDRSGYADVVIVLIITTGLRYFRHGINQQYRLQEIEAKRVKAELELLKSQVNPHFLFNTLNNLFSIALKNKDDETADGLLKLSQLMRYMIYESNVELVNIEKEIAYIKNYIELQKLRFDDTQLLNLHFEIMNNCKSIFICPMILIPFIENAFKHGFGTDEQNLIDIKLGIEYNLLTLRIKNSIGKSKPKMDYRKTGIGLDNVKRRLNLAYPNRHNLAINEENGFFIVDLNIKL